MTDSARPAIPVPTNTAERLVSNSRPDLNIVVLYETFLAGHLARRAYGGPAKSTPAQVNRQLSLWKLDFLSRPSMKHFVAQDAAAADIVVLALESSDPLEPTVLEWIEAWLAIREAKPVNLVACLMTRRNEYIDPDGCIRQLKAIADEAGIHFNQNVVAIIDEDLRLLAGSCL